jgi:hypothetical protein
MASWGHYLKLPLTSDPARGYRRLLPPAVPHPPDHCGVASKISPRRQLRRRETPATVTGAASLVWPDLRPWRRWPPRPTAPIKAARRRPHDSSSAPALGDQWPCARPPMPLLLLAVEGEAGRGCRRAHASTAPSTAWGTALAYVLRRSSKRIAGSRAQPPSCPARLALLESIRAVIGLIVARVVTPALPPALPACWSVFVRAADAVSVLCPARVGSRSRVALGPCYKVFVGAAGHRILYCYCRAGRTPRPKLGVRAADAGICTFIVNRAGSRVQRSACCKGVVFVRCVLLWLACVSAGAG